jgi:hypothetical protein
VAELDTTLTREGVGECGRREIEGGRRSIRLEAVTDSVRTFQIVKDVLTRLELLALTAAFWKGGTPPTLTRSTDKPSGPPLARMA